MNTLRLRRTFFVFAVVALAVTAIPLTAAPAIDGPVADVLLGTTQVQWAPKADFAGLRLTISGPNGTEQLAFGPGEAPLLDLASVVADIDGQYFWELRAAPNVDVQQIAAAVKTPGFAGGERQRPAGLPAAEDLVQSGSFRVVGGAIVQPMGEPRTELQVDGAGADKVTGDLGYITGELLHAEDVKIQGSLCVGFDCTNSESFGFDTIRLKENNLRITFVDTSNSASFPTNDWRIEANSSANGGGSYFAIIDVDGGRTPFQIDAGAPTNSLRVDSGGDLGLGVSNPVVELHVADGDTPTLRLEQNNSSGFTAQTWDVAGNETNFFVRDASNGSALSFRIKPGSGTDDALVIASNGDIGMGTDSPSESLHVRGNGGDSKILVEEVSGTVANRVLMELVNNGAAQFQFENTATSTVWNFSNASGGVFRINETGASGIELELQPDGDLIIDGTLTTNGPSCTMGCDRVFTPEFELESIEDHAAEMWANSHLPAVGPTGPGVPFNLTEKAGGILNELEKAHIYIEQLHQQVQELNGELATKNQRLASFEERLSQIEASLPQQESK